MDEDGVPGQDRPWQKANNYPDPSHADTYTTPYPALSQTQQDNQQKSDGENGVDKSRTNQQYHVLANQISNIIDNNVDDDPIDGITEGIPMSSSYLNISLNDEADDSSAVESDFDGDEPMNGSGSGHLRGSKKTHTKRRGWKWALKGTTHDPRNNREPREKASGKGRGGQRGKARRKTLDPGQAFKTAQAKATQAFVEGRLDEALESAREAVQANPEIFLAHSLLSEVLLAKGQEQDSLAALLSGAVTARDADTWIMVAERTLNYAHNNRTEEILQQAIFCYSQAIDLEKRSEHNFEARVCKMNLWIEIGELHKARRDCKQLVNLRPTDLDLIRQLAELSVRTMDGLEIAAARKAYEHALNETYGKMYDLNDDVLSAAWGHLNIYLELVDRTGTAHETNATLKRWARLFLGRRDETFWDKYIGDDREFDVDNIRRYEIVEYQQGRASRDITRYGESLPLELRIKLGISRLKMGQQHIAEAMLHLEDLLAFEEDADTLYDMFDLVGSTLLANSLHEEALQFFDPIVGLPETSTVNFHMKYAQAMKALERYDEAAASYIQATEIDPLHLTAKVELAQLYQECLKDNDRAHTLVNEIIAMNKGSLMQREKLHMRPRNLRSTIRALKRGLPNAQYGSEDEDEFTGEPGKAPRKRRKLDLDMNDEDLALLTPKERTTLERRRERKHRKEHEKRIRSVKTNERKMQMLESYTEQVAENFDIVQRLWSSLEQGTDEIAIDEWAEAASNLYEIFRSVKQFYPVRDKNRPFKGFMRLEPGEAKFMNDMESWKKRLETNDEDGDKDYTELFAAPKQMDESIPRDFYDISFKTWHHIFVDLALLHARHCQKTACYSIIDDGLFAANVFHHDQEILQTTQALSLCCAFIFNDSERLCFTGRWFLNRHDLRTASSSTLFAAVNRLSSGSSLWFSAGPTQKHMLRVVRALDYHYFTPEIRAKFDWSLQLPSLLKRVEKHGDGTGDLDANILLTYGHMVGVANHSQSALPYFFRAFAVQPENVTVVLSIATMFIQNAMKRQTDNRHYGIAQGLSFIHRYYDLRAASGEALDRQEAEFNVGRAWHMLGLTHLAVERYESVLALDTAVQENNDDRALRGDYAMESFTKEAAYALVNILAVTGNDEAARQLTEEYLVL